MNTKNENMQESLDLQVEDSVHIKEQTEKKTTKKSSTKQAGSEKKSAAKKKTTSKASKKKDDVEKNVKKSEVKTKKATKSKSTIEVEVKEDVKEESRSEIQLEEVNASAQISDSELSNTNSADVNVNEEAAAEPIVEDIKRYKLFFVSDMDEEAIYLHDMSLQGYHFVTKKGMQYTFRQGEPKNYFYHLGYYEKDKRDGERYLDNYVEAGWENIFHEKAEFDGVWNYFRIEMPIGEPEPNIFSDRVSRLALYKRLLSGWRTLLAVDIICFFFTIFVYIFLTNHPMNMTSIYKTLCAILDVIIVLIFIIYLRAYLKISRKQRELENL